MVILGSKRPGLTSKNLSVGYYTYPKNISHSIEPNAHVRADSVSAENPLLLSTLVGVGTNTYEHVRFRTNQYCALCVRNASSRSCTRVL